MELSRPFKFFTILSQAIRLISKNPKPISAIAAISLITPSICILLLSYSAKFLTNDPLLNIWVIVAVEIIFVLAFMALSNFIRVSTVLVSASSYTGKTISLQEVFPIFKSTLKMQTKTSFYRSRRSVLFGIVFGFLVSLAVLIPSVTTIGLAVLVGVPGLLYQVYLSVAWAVAGVVSVIEHDCHAKDAFDRANELVEGQRVHGFLMNMFLNLVVLLGFAGYWMATGGNIVPTDLTNYALVVINSVSLFQIFVLVAYTVFYFECKQGRGEEIESGLGSNVQYSKLPTVQLATDIV